MKLRITTDIEADDDGVHCGDCYLQTCGACFVFTAIRYRFVGPTELQNDEGGYLRCASCLANAKKIEGE